MPGNGAPNNGFRRQLRREIADWTSEGLINDDTAAALHRRYALDALPPSGGSHAFLYTVYIIGATLIGGGIVSFVAANWAYLPAPVKVTGLISLLLFLHGLGYYLALPAQNRPGLAQAVFLAGAFCFGACIGLFSQIFHLEGHFSTGFGLWAVGLTVTAFAVRSVPIAHLALAVSLVAYLGQVYRFDTLLLWYLPVMTGFGLGFAYWTRVPLTGTATLLVGIAAVLGTVAGMGGSPSNEFCLAAIGLSILLLGLSHLPRAPMGSRALGLTIAAVTAYSMSFLGGGREFLRALDDRGLFEVLTGHYLIVAVFLLGAVVWGAAGALGRLHRRGLATLPALALVANGLLLVPWLIQEALAFTVAANVAAAILAGGLLWQGTHRAERTPYWSGLAFAGLLIASRFFEYDTGLLVKSAVFVGCGVAVVLGGIRFEQRLREQEAPS